MTDKPGVLHFCPSCRHQLKTGARFCPACGESLTVSAIPPPRPESSDRPSIRVRYNAKLSELKRVGWLFGLLLLGSFVLGMVSRVVTSPWPEAIIAIAEALVVIAFATRFFSELLPLLLAPRLDRRSVAEMTAVALAFGAIMALYLEILERLGVPFYTYTDTFLNAGWPIWSIFVLSSVMPAVFEELAFRGVIQSSLSRVFSARETWLIQAALFSVLHLSPIIFPSHFVMGLALGWLRQRSNSLYPGILLHGAWNALVVCGELYLS